MSNEQSINSRKNENEEKRSRSGKKNAKKPVLPPNPAGFQELSDGDLEGIEGGAGRLLLGNVDTYNGTC